MATLEFYVRNESENEARGPFNLEQLASLAENGQVTADTLYYDATLEQWVSIGTSDEIKAALFPEKKKLKMKSRDTVQTLNTAVTDSTPPITVNDMLAAAEGRTIDTKDKQDPLIAMGRAAAIGRMSCVLILILAAAAEVLPSIDLLTAFTFEKLLTEPLVILGAIDVFFAVVLALGMVSVYPMVRFRAALGLGFLGFIFFTQGLSLPFLYVLAGSAGLYLCTVTVSLPLVLLSALIGIAGMAGVVYRMVLTS